MDFDILATDYDGTLARHAVVDDTTIAALERLRAAGKRRLLVTGRELHELAQIFPRFDLFDIIVGENGALLYEPSSQKIKLLCEPASREFADMLRARGVTPLFIGRAIVATQEPNEGVVAEIIETLKLPLEIILNKGSVMALPRGVNKASGLRAVLRENGWTAERTIAIGDAENDHDLLAAAGFGVAVSNAVPELKARADLVTGASHGAGVAELIDLWLGGRLTRREITPDLPRVR